MPSQPTYAKRRQARPGRTSTTCFLPARAFMSQPTWPASRRRLSIPARPSTLRQSAQSTGRKLLWQLWQNYGQHFMATAHSRS
jgi:hypothetical protein